MATMRKNEGSGRAVERATVGGLSAVTFGRRRLALSALPRDLNMHQQACMNWHGLAGSALDLPMVKPSLSGRRGKNVHDSAASTKSGIRAGSISMDSPLHQGSRCVPSEGVAAGRSGADEPEILPRRPPQHRAARRLREP